MRSRSEWLVHQDAHQTPGRIENAEFGWPSLSKDEFNRGRTLSGNERIWVVLRKQVLRRSGGGK